MDTWSVYIGVKYTCIGHIHAHLLYFETGNEMARRLNPRHSEEIRKKIQASQLINRLMSHIGGDVELQNSQITAIKILLDKSLPNLSDVKMEHTSQGITFNLNVAGVPDDEDEDEEDDSDEKDR
tara:strand:- start:32 stop:403 length:372 start_codon:yes stop_codon:yes gene_type:complete